MHDGRYFIGLTHTLQQPDQNGNSSATFLKKGRHMISMSYLMRLSIALKILKIFCTAECLHVRRRWERASLRWMPDVLRK
jgi:hypothetical protein